jgi:hypothetical protein
MCDVETRSGNETNGSVANLDRVLAGDGLNDNGMVRS